MAIDSTISARYIYTNAEIGRVCVQRARSGVKNIFSILVVGQKIASAPRAPALNTKSWLTISLDEATLRARLVTAPTNKGAIIQELRRLRKPFDDRLSLAPDKLPHVWATSTTWVEKFERRYYLYTFFDYNKNVYGLAPNQRPESAGQFGVIAATSSLLPSSLSTYIKRNFFDVDREPGDAKYKVFASPFLNKAK